MPQRTTDNRNLLVIKKNIFKALISEPFLCFSFKKDHKCMCIGDADWHRGSRPLALSNCWRWPNRDSFSTSNPSSFNEGSDKTWAKAWSEVREQPFQIKGSFMENLTSAFTTVVLPLTPPYINELSNCKRQFSHCICRSSVHPLKSTSSNTDWCFDWCFTGRLIC